MSTAPAPRPRRHRWLLALAGFVTLLVALPFAVPLWQDWRTERELADAIAETDRLDPGWRMEELLAKRPAVADTENGALVLIKIADFFGKDGIYSPVLTHLEAPPGIVAGSEKHRQWIDDVYDSFDNLDEVKQLNDAQLQAMEGECKQWRDSLVEARKLRGFRRGRGPDDDATQQRLWQGAVSSSRLLKFDVLCHCQSEAVEEATESAEAILGVARVMRKEPFHLAIRTRSLWLTYANESIQRLLGQTEPDFKRLAAIQASLEEEERFAHIPAAVRADRADWWRIFLIYRADGMTAQEREMFEKPLVIFDDEKPAEPPWYLKWMKPNRPDDPRLRQAQKLRRDACWMEFGKKPVADQAAEIDSFKKEVASLIPGEKFDSNAFTVEKWLPLQMRLRVTCAALALERYRQEKGTWPKSLDHLVPKYLSEVPVDFYTRKPLIYRILDDGIIVYSTGPDQTDNAGKLRPNPNEVVHPYRLPGLDIGVRLWDVAQRRQAPLPPILPRREEQP